eukprot:COSAG02_NODE_295_length_25421_cov_88.063226_7_plen_67_part_00
MKSCYLGPQALTSLADAIKLMAALTKIDVRDTKLDPKSLEALKAAASQECEVLCDYVPPLLWRGLR